MLVAVLDSEREKKSFFLNFVCRPWPAPSIGKNTISECKLRTKSDFIRVLLLYMDFLNLFMLFFLNDLSDNANFSTVPL